MYCFFFTFCQTVPWLCRSTARFVHGHSRLNVTLFNTRHSCLSSPCYTCMHACMHATHACTLPTKCSLRKQACQSTNRSSQQHKRLHSHSTQHRVMCLCTACCHCRRLSQANEVCCQLCVSARERYRCVWRKRERECAREVTNRSVMFNKASIPHHNLRDATLRACLTLRKRQRCQGNETRTSWRTCFVIDSS